MNLEQTNKKGDNVAGNKIINLNFSKVTIIVSIFLFVLVIVIFFIKEHSNYDSTNTKIENIDDNAQLTNKFQADSLMKFRNAKQIYTGKERVDEELLNIWNETEYGNHKILNVVVYKKDTNYLILTSKANSIKENWLVDAKRKCLSDIAKYVRKNSAIFENPLKIYFLANN